MQDIGLSASALLSFDSSLILKYPDWSNEDCSFICSKLKEEEDKDRLQSWLDRQSVNEITREEDDELEVLPSDDRPSLLPKGLFSRLVKEKLFSVENLLCSFIVTVDGFIPAERPSAASFPAIKTLIDVATSNAAGIRPLEVMSSLKQVTDWERTKVDKLVDDLRSSSWFKLIHLQLSLLPITEETLIRIENIVNDSKQEAYYVIKCLRSVYLLQL